MKAHNLVLGILLGVAAAAFGQDNLATWGKYKVITVNTKASGANVAGNVANFPLLVRLDSTNAAEIFAQALAGGADIRFSNASGAQRPYEIEHWNATTKTAAIWVLADTVKANDSVATLRIYWSRAGAISASNGAAVFDTANGFVGVWHLGNASGSAPRPSAVTGAPPAVIRNVGGTYQPVNGVIGMADSISGGPGTASEPTTDAGLGPYIDIGRTNYAGYSDFSNGVAYSVWINPNANLTSFERFFQLLEDTLQANANVATTRLVFFRHTNNSGSIAVRTNGITSGNTATTAFNAGTWKHVAFSKRPGTDSMLVFVDGARFYGYAPTADVAVVARNFAWIGRSYSSQDAYLNAKVDAPMLSKVARSANWMKLSYETQKSGANAVVLGSTQTQTVTPVAITNIRYVMPGTGNTPRDTLVFQATVPVNLPLQFDGGPADSVKLTTGTLPAGLTMNLLTGAITGTPTTVTAAANQTVTVYSSLGNVTRGLRMSVVPGPLKLVKYSQDTASYLVGVPAVNAAITSGRPATKFRINPALPAGLKIDTVTGAISGTPTATSAAANYTVTASNATDSSARSIRITVGAAESYSTWTRHRTIYFNTSLNSNGARVSGNVTNFPVAIRLGSTDSVYTQVLANAADLRFTKADDATFLPYEIEQWDSAGKSATIWVLVDTVKGNSLTQTIRMHWGKAGAPNLSSGSTVFSVANGFQAVWHMNAGTGDEKDATANGFLAVAQAAPGDTVGAVGKARKFNGTSNFFQVANSVTGPLDFGLDQNYTISAWAYPRLIGTNNDGHKLVEKGDNQWTLAVYFAGNPKYWEITTKLNNGAATWAQCTSEGAGVTAESGQGKWNHIFGTYRGTPVGGAMAESLFVNGTFMATRTETVSSLTTSRTTTVPVNIGAQGTGVLPAGTYTRYWDGALDEIRLSSVVRSADWNKLEYENQKPGQTLVSFTQPVSIQGSQALRSAGEFSVKSAGRGLVFGFQGAREGKASIALVDVFGRTVWSGTFASGASQLAWDGRSVTGADVAAGIYSARLTVLDKQGRAVQVLDRRVPYTR